MESTPVEREKVNTRERRMLIEKAMFSIKHCSKYRIKASRVGRKDAGETAGVFGKCREQVR